jgi:hypothetical protein
MPCARSKFDDAMATKVTTSNFEFLNPRTKRDFEFYGAVAAALLVEHQHSPHYAAMIEAFIDEVFIQDDAPSAIYKPAEATLNETANGILADKRGPKEAKQKNKYRENDDDDLDYLEDGCAGTQTASNKATIAESKVNKALGARADDDEMDDELMTEEDLARATKAHNEQLKAEKEEEERLAAAEKVKAAAAADNAAKNAARAKLARTTVDTKLPEGMVMVQKDDDFGAFGKKGKGKGKKK